jgi:O-acetyl-ADP-ribose deacetylase (regulator of RNase III)
MSTTTFELVRGDITEQEVDAIVNAANQGLLGGGGVDGAIHRAAGPHLLEACRALPVVDRRAGHDIRCPTGEARRTEGFGLPARHVIHAVGPRWRGGDHGEDEALAGAYAASVALAAELGAASLALPSIATGVYGFPLERAARIAHDVLHRAAADAEDLELVRMVLFSEGDLATYREVWGDGA